jgi:hypothetical protein
MNPANPTHPTAVALRRPDPRPLAVLAAGLAATLALSFLAATPARGDDERFRSRHLPPSQRFDTWADGRLVDVQILVDGQAVPLYFAPGRFDRHYLQAFAGRNYSIVLRNNTGERVAVLLAVDGLNAVSGDLTKRRSHEPMYVLGPWEQATIRGWRTSLDEIRRFVFVDEKRSYAERTGQGNSDMGWIRVLAFREQRPVAWKQNLDWGRARSDYRGGGSPLQEPAAPEAPRAQGGLDSREEAGPQKSAAPESKRQAFLPPTEQDMARGESESRGSFPGTGWGDRREDHVRRVEFNPQSAATDHLVFRYEYASGLRALGIEPHRGPWRDRLGERDGDLGFARPPKW